ncbi:MAG: hypothetical protein WC518_00375 [Patescibacteria group bacterium]
MISREKKKGFNVYLVLIVVVVLFLALLGANFWLVNKSFQPLEKSQDSNVDIALDKSRAATKIKEELVVKLEQMEKRGKFGNWPLVLAEIKLSDNRDNPFVKKLVKESDIILAPLLKD